MQSSSKTVGWIIRFCAYSTLVAVGWVLWPYLFGVPATGPTLIKVDRHGTVWVLVDNDLYQLASDGALLNTLRAKQLNITHEVSDFAILESGEVWIGEGSGRVIDVLGPHGSRLREFILPERARRSFDNNVKLATVPGGDEVVVSDSDQHRILVLDSLGKERKRFGTRGAGPGQFAYPNGISLVPQGGVLIADSRNHRIVHARLDGTVIDSFDSVPAASTTRARFPTYVAADPDGGFAVVNKEDGLRFTRGEVVIFDAKSHQPKVAELPVDADPEGIAFFQDGWLVADVAGWRVLRLSRDGALLGELGGDDFRSALGSYTRGPAKHRRRT
jgi:hypothetical protein